MCRPNLLHLGWLVQQNASRLLLGATLGLLALCLAIKSAKLDSELSSWIQRTRRVETELSLAGAAMGESVGGSSQLLLQIPSDRHSDVLSVEALMVHLEAMAIATHIAVDLYDVTWTLKDLCFTPTLPDYEGPHVGLALDHLMPCAIKTPLDCFWEGAKLLGPDQPVHLGTLGPPKWTSLNPKMIIEHFQSNHPHASFSYDNLLDWMSRVGISSGYQLKPCLDPTDPNCPDSAPNKLSRQPPDVGAQLTGGCRGVAANQMHWHEEEIVGGLERNRSGHIVRASALQSTIQLMGGHDMYDYWRKTDKVQDINNWSAEKAKLVLDTWQHRFKEELAQFKRTSASSSDYKIHAMTSNSMIEPIDVYNILDLTNFQLCLTIMTVFLCFVFPNFSSSTHAEFRAGFLKRILVAVVSSSFIGLTFMASLGLSSFMNLPFNMATIQILTPLALYLGFNQYNLVANVYSQKFRSTPAEDLTSDCIKELFPTIIMDSLCHSIAFLMATIIPVPATRVFAFQALTYIMLSTLTALILMPAIMTIFLLRQTLDSYEPPKNKSTLSSNRRIGICSSIQPTEDQMKDSVDNDDQILSRIQDDLKHIRADNWRPTDINFSAHLGADGLCTSFKLTTSQDFRQKSLSSSGSINTPKPKQNDLVVGTQNYDANAYPMPDLIASSLPKRMSPPPDVDNDDIKVTSEPIIVEEPIPKSVDEAEHENIFFRIYANGVVENKLIQVMICFLALAILVAMLSQYSKVSYNLPLSDIIAQGTPEHESFLTQEKYFPVYNIFIITRGNFDYPTNQRLMHEFYKELMQVEGVVREEDTTPKFWLAAFRDWLLEIQHKFDVDRNKSAITSEGWSLEVSEATKLAYKLLAQTGRVDNPVDKSLVETNRLVDSNGIINPKAFYHYLPAWVNNDAFTYANSEASLKPEPKFTNNNPSDLRIEKARPLIFAQIPILMKLPANQESLNTILKLRSTSQAFEQLNLPNFPTGVPFIFWDQFINLDLMFSLSIALGGISIFIIIAGIVARKAAFDFRIAAIVTMPIIITLLELYGFMGYLSIPFNNVLAVLLICTMGISTVQTVHLASYFTQKEGQLACRTRAALASKFRLITTSLALFTICVFVFQLSHFNFMIKYSYLLFCLAILNGFNSLFLTPVMLSLFGSDYKPCSLNKLRHPNAKTLTKVVRRSSKKEHRVRKKRGYPRVQSEISLSTISEEPQSEAQVHDLKFDLSIKCY